MSARRFCDLAFSDFFSMPGMLPQDAVVAEITVCVTFGALRSGPLFRSISCRLEYVTFSTISATGVREITVSVTFGALLFAPLITSCRRPICDHVSDIAQTSCFAINNVEISLSLGGCDALCLGASRSTQMCGRSFAHCFLSTIMGRLSSLRAAVVLLGCVRRMPICVRSTCASIVFVLIPGMADNVNVYFKMFYSSSLGVRTMEGQGREGCSCQTYIPHDVRAPGVGCWL